MISKREILKGLMGEMITVKVDERGYRIVESSDSNKTITEVGEDLIVVAPYHEGINYVSKFVVYYSIHHISKIVTRNEKWDDA